MIEWYDDKFDLSIYFSCMPDIKERFITPITPKEQIDSIKKYPYQNKKEIAVIIFDHINEKQYKFRVPKSYCYDGATIPRLVWFFCGSPTDNRYMVGAMVHDILCEKHNYCGCDRELSTRILKALFIKGGTNKIQANIMCWFVDVFQKYFGKWDKE